MTQADYDVVGIGNAIVDVLARADDNQLIRLGLTKGAMQLIDEPTADRLYAASGPGVECSGGSAANTIAGLASLGGRGAYMGKVRNDQLGKIFAHDIRALGVAFDTAPADRGPSTARCLIFVTPDGQRTMNTYLGAATEFGPAEIDAGLIARSRIVYLEGYLFDRPPAKAAFRAAVTAARAAGRQVALSLSDSFCVERHREDFLDLLRQGVDILFANEAEIVSLFRAADFDQALQQARGRNLVMALTRSEKGSLVLRGEELHVVDAVKIPKVVDTTGAGDLYAAGFLHGFARGRDLAGCGRLGGICAAEVIGHFGARPETKLAALAGALAA
ncbi:MAG: adenosine kinase [Alphaproteobacteria bacterium]|nr:adenosine kinase [Alphaproteobacteria bacterium]